MTFTDDLAVVRFWLPDEDAPEAHAALDRIEREYEQLMVWRPQPYTDNPAKSKVTSVRVAALEARLAEAERVLSRIANERGVVGCNDAAYRAALHDARAYLASREQIAAPTPEQKAEYLRQFDGPTVDLASREQEETP